MKPSLSVEEVDEICQWYQEGDSIEAIRKAYGVSGTAIHNHLKRRNIPRRAVCGVKEMVDLKYGLMTVLCRAENTKDGLAQWLCLCECGVKKVVRGSDLRKDSTISCGCYKDSETSKRSTTHGMSNTREYKMWRGAKCRARQSGLEFNLAPSDIVIPDQCPITGVKLQLHAENGVQSDNSPSLDRINNAFGYIKGNVAVISYKANRYKSDMTLDDVNRLRDYMMSNNTNPVAAD